MVVYYVAGSPKEKGKHPWRSLGLQRSCCVFLSRNEIVAREESEAGPITVFFFFFLSTEPCYKVILLNLFGHTVGQIIFSEDNNYGL